jgi:hypothetical protein
VLPPGHTACLWLSGVRLIETSRSIGNENERTNRPNTVMSQGTFSAQSSRTWDQLPIQLAAISSTITAQASQMPSRRTNPSSTKPSCPDRQRCPLDLSADFHETRLRIAPLSSHSCEISVAVLPCRTGSVNSAPVPRDGVPGVPVRPGRVAAGIAGPGPARAEPGPGNRSRTRPGS